MGKQWLTLFWGAPKSLLEKAMATHSSTLAWKIPWTEEPGRLQPMGSQRVGHDWVTSLSLSYIVKGFPGGSAVKNPPANAGDGGSVPGSGRSPGEGNCSPLQSSCLGNPTDRGAWQTASMGSQKSQTGLSDFSDTYLKSCTCESQLGLYLGMCPLQNSWYIESLLFWNFTS